MMKKIDAVGNNVMSESQQIFDELDKKIKKLEEQLQPESKDKHLELIKVVENLETEDAFKKQLAERLQKESIVEVYQKKDGSFVIASVPEKEGLLVISLCINAVLIVILITKAVGLW
ncbi:MAG: hypothetical protein IMZ58_07620 [Thermoplasmata archaeon]|nr:hypothetical protein [Thermoplasmata archaeon]